MKRAGKFYASHVVTRSLIDGSRFFFCPKVELFDNGACKVIGKKYDITESLQPYLQKRYRAPLSDARRKKDEGK